MSKWYIEPSNHKGCVYIESVERSIAHHVTPEDAEEIVSSHNAALEAADRQAALAAENERLREAGDLLAGITRCYLAELETSDGPHPDDFAAAVREWEIAEAKSRALAAAPAVAPTCPCGHPRYHHTGWPGEKTGNCLRCSCPAWGTVQMAPGAEDAGRWE